MSDEGTELRAWVVQARHRDEGADWETEDYYLDGAAAEAAALSSRWYERRVVTLVEARRVIARLREIAAAKRIDAAQARLDGNTGGDHVWSDEASAAEMFADQLSREFGIDEPTAEETER